MSVYFDGSNDYAWAEGTPPVTSHNPSTIALWFKRTDAYAGGGDVLARLGQKNGDADQLLNYIQVYSNSNGSIAGGANDGTSRNSDTINVDTAGNWIHAAAVFTGNTTRYSYLGGDTANRGGGTGLVSCAPAAFESVYLGSSPAIGNSYTGYLAHVAVWNLALSSTDIEALAAGALPTDIQAANLQMYYPCTNSGQPGEDTIGGFDLALAGNAAYNADNPTLSSGSPLILPHRSSGGMIDLSGNLRG